MEVLYPRCRGDASAFWPPSVVPVVDPPGLGEVFLSSVPCRTSLAQLRALRFRGGPIHRALCSLGSAIAPLPSLPAAAWPTATIPRTWPTSAMPQRCPGTRWPMSRPGPSSRRARSGSPAPAAAAPAPGQLPVGRKLSTTSATSLPLPSAMALTRAHAELGLGVGRTQCGEGGDDDDGGDESAIALPPGGQPAASGRPALPRARHPPRRVPEPPMTRRSAGWRARRGSVLGVGLAVSAGPRPAGQVLGRAGGGTVSGRVPWSDHPSWGGRRGRLEPGDPVRPRIVPLKLAF